MLQILFLGRILSGIGTSLLFSAPESWLVGEAQSSGDDPDGSWLGETFGLVRQFSFLLVETVRLPMFLLGTCHILTRLFLSTCSICRMVLLGSFVTGTLTLLPMSRFISLLLSVVVLLNKTCYIVALPHCYMTTLLSSQRTL